MARVNNLNQSLCNEDYAMLLVSINGRNHEVALYKSQGELYLLTNLIIMNGNSCVRAHDAVSKKRYKYSWVLDERVSNLSIKRVFEENHNWDDRRTVELVAMMAVEDATADEIAPTSMFIGEFLSEHYTTDEWYTGQDEYHERSCSMNTPIEDYSGHRIGVELEVEFSDDDERDSFNEIPSNWFYRESDGSLDDYGCEIITIPLLPDDAKSTEFWNPLVLRLKDRAVSWDSGNCGLHVHIGREILGNDAEEKSETIGKMLFLYHNFLKYHAMNIKIYGRERGYSDCECKTDVSDAAKLLGSAVFKDKGIKDRVKDSLIGACQRDRYFDINLMNSNTIEFRKGRGSINSERIAMVVEYSELICLYARQIAWEDISYESFIEYIYNKAQQPKLKKIIEQYN